ILRFLGRRLAGTRLMILATFRSEEVGSDHPLTVVMGDLATLPGVVRMQLPALSVIGVRQLLDDAGSALDAGDVYQRTGGTPFYVTEVLAVGSGHLPATVRDAVLARVSRLAVEGSLPQAQRAAAHARALAQLVARGSADHRQLAHHAAGSGDRAAVVHHAPLAAARAARLGAHREAADQLRPALRFHAMPGRRAAALAAPPASHHY